MPTMGKSLHYLDVGSGFPLLLGHSYLFDLNMWAPQFEALAKRYRLIVPDLWGLATHRRCRPGVTACRISPPTIWR